MANWRGRVARRPVSAERRSGRARAKPRLGISCGNPEGGRHGRRRGVACVGRARTGFSTLCDDPPRRSSHGLARPHQHEQLSAELSRGDRKSIREGKRVTVVLVLGGSRSLKKKKKT